jgi:histidine triad (HIT) family protein
MALIDDCIFCRIIRKEIPADTVYEDENVLALNDINPQAPVHILIIPKEHIPTIDDLRLEHDVYLAAIFSAVRSLAVEKGLVGDGYRLVLNCREQAGQSVFHIHLHMLGGRAMRWPPG